MGTEGLLTSPSKGIDLQRILFLEILYPISTNEEAKQ